MADSDQGIDPIYFTDEYPREGCQLTIEVREDRCSMSVIAPGGRVIESYLPPRDEVGRYVQEWLGGIVSRVKPSHRRPDQQSPGKSG